MLIEFTEQDILSSKIVMPAWYRVEITDVVEKPSNNGQSMNTWIKGKILFNADNGSKDFAGVPAPYLWFFNSKAAWAAVGFCASLGMEVAAGKRANLSRENLVGKQIDMFIGNALTQEGKTVNSVTDQYRTPRDVAQQAVV